MTRRWSGATVSGSVSFASPPGGRPLNGVPFYRRDECGTRGFYNAQSRLPLIAPSFRT